MRNSKSVIGLILLLFFLFVFFESIDYPVVAFYIKSLIGSVLAFIYFVFVKKKELYFSLFLVLYALADLVYIFNYHFNFSDTLRYLLGNILYLFAYGVLLCMVFKSILWKKVLREFKIHFIFLVLLNIYIVYVLEIVTKSHFENSSIYIVEVIYNLEMLILLTVALLNYFCRDNIKSLYIFIGSLSIVLSEILGLAYWYISKYAFFNFTSEFLILLAFYFFYLQSHHTIRKIT